MVGARPIQIWNNAVRAKEIFSILVRYGFGQLLDQIGAPASMVQKIFGDKDAQSYSTWKRIRLVFQDLGPTFIKFGQALSMRPDVLPPALIEELRHLQDQVKPVPFEQMSKILEEELPQSYREIFSEFDEEPIACASLGQVYKARLRASDVAVVVKILKPGMRRAMQSDLEILGWLAREAHEKLDDLKKYDLPALIEETKEASQQELYLMNEAHNSAYFTSLNEHKDEVFAPEVFQAYSTDRVLVTEYVQGEKPDRDQYTVEEASELARRGARTVFYQIFIMGFFHADPHRGNILVTEDHRICLIDWGLAGQLTREMRYFLADFFSAVASQDSETVMRSILSHAVPPKRINLNRMEKEVGIVLRNYQDVAQKNELIGDLMVSLLRVCTSYGLQLSRDYIMLARAISSIQSLAKELDPAINLQEIADPILKELAKDRWNPVHMMTRSIWMMRRQMCKLREFPDTLFRILRRTDEEGFVLRVEHNGLDRASEAIGDAVNRLVFAIIVGALIIGSSLVITTGVEPLLWGYPVIGIIGYIISGLLGLWTLFDILRHGRRK